jgi:hypothetical protein
VAAPKQEIVRRTELCHTRKTWSAFPRLLRELFLVSRDFVHRGGRSQGPDSVHGLHTDPDFVNGLDRMLEITSWLARFCEWIAHGHDIRKYFWRFAPFFMLLLTFDCESVHGVHMDMMLSKNILVLRAFLLAFLFLLLLLNLRMDSTGI